MNAEKYHNTRPIPELTESDKRRFWAKIKKLGPGDCWEWQAGTNKKGYGVIGLGGRPGGGYLAHRVSFSIHHQISHTQEDMRHTCDNPPCCNPAHLITGSIGDNARDAVERGLIRHGEGHYAAKLTNETVMEIRSRYAQGGFSLEDLAKEYGIGHQNASDVVTGKRWKHLPLAASSIPPIARKARGAKNGSAVLTEESVIEILRDYKTGKVSQRELGRRFGVDASTIYLIVHRKHWKHVSCD